MKALKPSIPKRVSTRIALKIIGNLYLANRRSGWEGGPTHAEADTAAEDFYASMTGDNGSAEKGFKKLLGVE